MFFVDSADTEQIKNLAQYGIVDGVTTNPTLIKKSGKIYSDVLKQICSIVTGPVSAEVTSTTSDKMVEEGLSLCMIAQNIIIKVPCTKEGLIACHRLKMLGKKVNVTLCFCAAQAILAAKAGADYISPFIGRLEDIGHNGIDVISDIVDIYSKIPGVHTKVLAASIRTTEHLLDSLRVGAHVITAPPKILDQMFDHPLTQKGLDIFLKDWADTGQKIS